MALLAVPPVYQALALSALLGWPVPMFRYLYDRMHKRNFWMTLKTQRRHDLRHRSVDSSGFELRPVLLFFGGSLRTIAKRRGPIKGEGFQAAMWRLEVDETEPLPLASCSAALFHRFSRGLCPFRDSVHFLKIEL